MEEPTIIVEIDGVLASLEGREHLLEKKRVRPAHWIGSDEGKEFLERGWSAEPVGGVTDLLYGFFHGHPSPQIIISTWRPSYFKAETLEWLYDNEIKFDALIMRPGFQVLTEPKIKKNNLKSIKAFGYNPTLVLEWDELNAEMYNEHGIRTLVEWKPKCT